MRFFPHAHAALRKKRQRIKRPPPWRPGGTPTPINPERIARLQTLGLNEQQARAYLALLDAGTATVNDLSKTSRVPRAKLYEVMESLNKKGLVDVIPETPQRFRANPVSALYDNRVEELRAEEAELKRTVGELMVLLAKGPTDAGRTDPERDFVHVAHGRTHFPVVTKQLVENATRSITIVGDRLLPARLRLYEDVGRALAQATARVPVRILLPTNAVDQVEGRRIRLDELEPQIRRAPLTLGDATVVVRDEQEYVVTRFLPNDLHPSRGSDRVEVGRDPEIAVLWERLILDLWARGTAWPPDRAPS